VGGIRPLSYDEWSASRDGRVLDYASWRSIATREPPMATLTEEERLAGTTAARAAGDRLGLNAPVVADAIRPPELGPRPNPQAREAQGVEGFAHRVAGAVFGMAENPVATAASVVTAPAHAVKTLGDYAGERAAEATLPPEVAHYSLTNPSRVSARDAAIAAIQLAAIAAAPAVAGRTTAALGGGTAAKTAAGALTGGGVNATFTPDDPLVGATVGALLAGAGGFVHGRATAQPAAARGAATAAPEPRRSAADAYFERLEREPEAPIEVDIQGVRHRVSPAGGLPVPVEPVLPVAPVRVPQVGDRVSSIVRGGSPDEYAVVTGEVIMGPQRAPMVRIDGSGALRTLDAHQWAVDNVPQPAAPGAPGAVTLPDTPTGAYVIPYAERNWALTGEGGRFVYARDPGGRLRGALDRIETEGLADELARLYRAQNEDAALNVPSIIPDENFHSSSDARPWVGKKEGAMRAAGRMAARQKSIDRIEAELLVRGADPVQAIRREAPPEPALESGRDPATGDFYFAPRRRGVEDAPSLFPPEQKQMFGDELAPVSESMVGKRETAPPPPAEAPTPPLVGRTEHAPGQSDLFGSPGREPVMPAPAAPSTAAAFPVPGAAPSPPRPGIPARVKQMAAELGATAFGAISGAAAAPEGFRTAGAVIGAMTGRASAYGAITALQRGAKHQAALTDAKPLIEINRTLAAAVGVPLRQGRSQMLRQSALGWFRPSTEVIRLRRFDQVATGAHEVGHYISKRYLGNPTMSRTPSARVASSPVVLTAAQRAELVAAGRKLYGNRKPSGGYAEEGIAEFFKAYVTAPDQLAADFPQVTSVFESILEGEPVVRDALHTARTDFQRYKESPASKRLAAIVSVDEMARVKPTLTDLRRVVEDDLIDVKQTVRDIERELTGKVGTANDPYTFARLTRGYIGEAGRALEDGVVINGTKVAEGIQPVLQAVRDNTQAFREYLIAERAIELAERGIESGVDVPSAMQVAKRDAPQFRAHAEQIWAFQRAMIDLRESVGLLTPDEAAAIKAKNQRHVSFYRVFDPTETAARGGRGGRGLAKSGAGIKSIKGSAREIIDPLESLVKDAYQTYRQVREHEAASQLIKLGLEAEGGGRFFEVVEAPKIPHTVGMETALRQLADLGLLDSDKIEALTAEQASALMATRLTEWKPKPIAGRAEAKDLVMPVVLNGTRKWIQVKDATLYNTLLGMNKPEMSMLERVWSWPTRTLRTGATLTAEFIARNPVRDAWAGMVRTQAGRPVAPGEHLVRGLFSLVKKDAAYDAWIRAGGENAAMAGIDRVAHQKSLRQLQATAAEKGWAVIQHPVDFLRAASSFAENATRLGEFKLVQQKELRAGAAPDAASRTAALAARDISTDFAKSGTVMRHANAIVAFLNANVQGTANLARDMRYRPEVVLPRAIAGITIPSIALYLLQKDDPVYQNLPDYVRRTSWPIVLPNGKVMVIPKPFDYGVLFGTAPERIVEQLTDADPQAGQKLVDDLLATFVPPVLPTALVPIVENFANKSTFTDRPIVPQSAQDLIPAEQAGPRTGETARIAGRMLDYSPAKLENVVRGYTGGLGTTALEIADKGVEMVQAARGAPPIQPPEPPQRTGAAAMPGVRAFFRDAPGLDADPVETFYELRDRAEMLRRTWREYLARGDRARADAFFAQHRDAIVGMATAEEAGSQAGLLRQIDKGIQELRDQRSTVLAMDIPEDRRRSLLRVIDNQIIELARRAVQ
jgi:hypothetical protein